MPTHFFADNTTRDPTILLINQTKSTLQGLLDNYNTVYANYLLILNNPPSDISIIANYGTNIKNAYTTFLPNEAAAAVTAGTPAAAGTSTAAVTTAITTAAVGTAPVAVTTPAQAINSLQLAIDKYNTAISNAQITLNSLYTQINTNAMSLTSLIEQVMPIGNGNRAKVDASVANLLEKIDEMQKTYHDFNTLLIDEPSKLDGNYELSNIKTNSNFFKYILYLFFAIFVIGCLSLLHFFPSSAYLDMFIMALAAIIIVYYGYDYFENRNNTKV
jgi:hypothetical protein